MGSVTTKPNLHLLQPPRFMLRLASIKENYFFPVVFSNSKSFLFFVQILFQASVLLEKTLLFLFFALVLLGGMMFSLFFTPTSVVINDMKNMLNISHFQVYPLCCSRFPFHHDFSDIKFNRNKSLTK